MPFKKQKMMRYYKITCWFKTGVKSYNISLDKKNEFMKNLKQRNDVIKYVVENTFKYIS